MPQELIGRRLAPGAWPATSAADKDVIAMPLCRTLCALALADTLLAALPTRANAEVRFEGNAFKAPADWATFPNARPGSWQIQRRLEVGRDRSTSCGPSPAATRC